MFKFNELKQIHLEITNNCQASCPMCARNIHGGLENPNIKLKGWSLDQYKAALSLEVLNQIEGIYFCGNYGDPLLNNDLLEMVKYTTEVNKNINLRIHTNGSLRNKSWWKDLALALPKTHNVVFAIDGLEDTHSIYRIGTNYNKIIENAKAFIDAGGSAEWAFIRFKHNENQVDEVREIASKLGFDSFTMKDSSRWLLEPKFNVLDKNGNTSYYLEPSQHSAIKIIDHSIVNQYREIIKSIDIDCYAKHSKEIYLDAYGHLFPCCWLGAIPYNTKDLENELLEVRTAIHADYYDLVESLGGIDNLDITKKSIKDIVNSKEYQSVWDFYWNDRKLITCGRSCGKAQNVEFSKPNDQFVKKDEL